MKAVKTFQKDESKVAEGVLRLLILPLPEKNMAKTRNRRAATLSTDRNT
jgi:hypothetical protein